MNREGKDITSEDQQKIRSALNREAKLSWKEKRLRAMVFLAWSSGIRLGEMCSLNLGDVLDRVGKKKWRVKEIFRLTKSNAKSFFDGQKWSYATGKVRINRHAREALRAYILAAVSAKKIDVPIDAIDSLWVSQLVRPICKRNIEQQWVELQKRIELTDENGHSLYRWHDLRHTALTIIAEHGNAMDVMELGRFRSLKNVVRYVRPSDKRIFELMDKRR